MTENKPTLNDVANYGNLLVAHANARKRKSKYYGVKRCEAQKDKMLHKLETYLLEETYHTSKYHHKIITDSGKERKISKLPYFPDRIVHWAIVNQLEEYFIKSFSLRSHAAIPNKGIHSALSQTRAALRNPDNRYCLKIDIRKYFQNINHEVLKRKLTRYAGDEKLLTLLYEIVDSFPEGIPIGNYTSQYFANIYLTSFDYFIGSTGHTHIRYMDDVVIFGKTAEDLHRLFPVLRQYLNDVLDVDVKDNWQVFPVASRGVDFVGYRVYPNRVLLRKSTFQRMRRRLLKVLKTADNGILTDHNRSVIAAYAGWVNFCTPKVRRTIYSGYFLPILEKVPADKFSKKITEKFL